MLCYIIISNYFPAYSLSVVDAHDFETCKVRVRIDHASDHLPHILTACCCCCCARFRYVVIFVLELMMHLIIFPPYSLSVVVAHDFEMWKVCVSDRLCVKLSSRHTYFLLLGCTISKREESMLELIMQLTIFPPYSKPVVIAHNFELRIKLSSQHTHSIYCGAWFWNMKSSGYQLVTRLTIFPHYSLSVVGCARYKKEMSVLALIMHLLIFPPYSLPVVASPNYETCKVRVSIDHASAYLPSILTTCCWCTSLWNVKWPC